MLYRFINTYETWRVFCLNKGSYKIGIKLSKNKKYFGILLYRPYQTLEVHKERKTVEYIIIMENCACIVTRVHLRRFDCFS